jgi:hypothetical protein
MSLLSYRTRRMVAISIFLIVMATFSWFWVNLWTILGTLAVWLPFDTPGDVIANTLLIAFLAVPAVCTSIAAYFMFGHSRKIASTAAISLAAWTALLVYALPEVIIN